MNDVILNWKKVKSLSIVRKQIINLKEVIDAIHMRKFKRFLILVNNELEPSI